MAETTQFVSRISVKDLISAFESKSETVKVEFSRPRARSFGNVLNKNVIVRLNEFITLEDIEKGLTKLETDLNFYEVYNKAKHVAFQEQFFNILTSVANIENSEEDAAPVRKKRLISRTQTLVSFLNQKLPTNINQVIETKPDQFKYTPYSSHIKNNPKNESKPLEIQQNNNVDVQPTFYVENTNTPDVTDSGGEYFVSVKKLKQNFQQKNEDKIVEPPKQEKVVRVTQKVGVTAKAVEQPKPKLEIKQAEELPIEENNTNSEEKVEVVSVTKLRSLFEQKSSSKGLEILTVDKPQPQLTKNDFGGSAQNINSIPYTERNLGTLRLQRSVSGNYMNYSGLLKRVDINRSSSNLELSRYNTRIVAENTSDEDSGAESEDTLENDNESKRVETISSVAKDNQKPAKNNYGKEHVYIVKQADDVPVKSSYKPGQEINNNKTEDFVSNGRVIFASHTENHLNTDKHVSSLQGFTEQKVNYSKASIEDVNKDGSKDVTEELSFKGVDEIEVKTGTATSKNIEENIATLEVVPQSIISTSDDSNRDESNEATEELTLKSVVEEEVNSGTAISKSVQEQNIATTQNNLSFKGYNEEEVKQGTALTENVQTEENVAKLEATTQEVSQSVSTSGDSKEAEDDRTTENELSFRGYGEEEVNKGTAFSENVKTEENVAKLEAATQDVSHSVSTSETEDEDHVFENSRDDYSSFSSLHELEDERDRSLIQEVIEKIDVEQTLANADLVVNPEDLKNADDEFEKLLENSQSGK